MYCFAAQSVDEVIFPSVACHPGHQAMFAGIRSPRAMPTQSNPLILCGGEGGVK